jgi:carbamoyl-phosphate synthase small subunit
VRELTDRPSSWRSAGDLDGFLRRHEVSGIAGIDTRRLTRHIREAGAMTGAFGTADEVALKEAAASERGTAGADLVSEVTCDSPYRVAAERTDDRNPWRLVAVDYGIKSAMIAQLRTLGDVEIVPASTSGEEILARHPHGVFLSNGPGDPAAVTTARATIEPLLGAVPVFGICLGHQLLASSLGASTYKLPFGHHGGNHPVRDVTTGEVEITSQNHNFCVADDLPDADLSHVNLNDGTVEGIRCREIPAFSVQYHPEAGPGPHDALYLFARFDELLTSHHRGGVR